MHRAIIMRKAIAFMFATLLFAPLIAHARKPAPAPEGVPIIIDSGRILLDVSFITAEGKERKALAWFNMGMAAPVLSHELYAELGLKQGAAFAVKVGEKQLEAPAEKVVDGDGGVGVTTFAHLFAPRRVEAMLPARMFTDYVLRIDYGRRLISINAPGGERPKGSAVPILINADTGVIAVEAQIDGQSWPLAIDAGSGYSWMRGDVARDLLVRHPDWKRAHGAIGPSNANMVDFRFEKEDDVFRAPVVRIGEIELKQVGFLATAPVLGSFEEGVFGDLFWDNWRKAAAAPVIGWLGGNALRDYELTIDYPNRMSYWLRQRSSVPTELNQPPITLVRHGDRYFIGGIVQSSTNAESPQGIETGDELIAVGDVAARGASKDSLLSALHGAPGDRKRLTLEHHGVRLETEMVVESFE